MFVSKYNRGSIVTMFHLLRFLGLGSVFLLVVNGLEDAVFGLCVGFFVVFFLVAILPKFSVCSTVVSILDSPLWT